MSIEMRVEYNGYTVTYTDIEQFRILKDGAPVKSKMASAEACEQWIDKQNKQKFKRVAVLTSFGYRGEIRAAEATSVVEENYAWVTDGKDRSKVNMGYIWVDTPENRQRVADTVFKKSEIKRLESEIKELADSAEKLTAEMMVE